MERRSRLALLLVAASLGMGVLGDALLRATPWGINAALWIAALVAVVALLAWRNDAMIGDARWLALPIIVFAACVAWRDSETLVALDVLLVIGLVGIAAGSAQGVRLRVGGVLQYGFAFVLAGIAAIVGPFSVLLNEMPWRELQTAGRRRSVLPVLRGLVIAVPLLCIFGALFASADAVFASSVSRVFDWDASWIIEHGFVIGVCAWLVLSVLWLLFMPRAIPIGSIRRPDRLRLGAIEIATVLGLLNGLFALFVVFQLRYLLGGEAYFDRAVGLTYAEYARRGFFELVTVAALLLPTLLSAHWLLKPDGQRSIRLFQALSGGLILFLGVILVSAVQRMRLYQQAYGLTELRLYTTVFMGWLALVFVVFLLTVWRNRSGSFATSALVLGLVFLFGLHVLNPDGLIVGTNAARHDIQPFDGSYASSLSADAVPDLIRALPLLPPDQRCQIATGLLDDWNSPVSPDWRTINWSRMQAGAAVAANADQLRSSACSTR